MGTTTGALVIALVLATGASAMLAAPGQTQQPGQMTQARVWIENHDRAEAVPVSLQEVALDAPLRVRVVNAHPSPTVDEPVYVRVVRQPIIWQYDTISLRADENVAATLSQRGASGWETTGISLPRADGGTTLVLKRSR